MPAARAICYNWPTILMEVCSQMHEQSTPFLSAAAIRRVLTLHPFSESNRLYLLQEAERRDEWEHQVEMLLCEDLPSPEIATSSPVPTRELTGADVVTARNLQPAPPR